MLDILDVENNEERDDSDSGRPEAKIPSPDTSEVLDLKGGLYGSRGNKGSEGNLSSAYGQPVSIS